MRYGIHSRKVSSRLVSWVFILVLFCACSSGVDKDAHYLQCEHVENVLSLDINKSVKDIAVNNDELVVLCTRAPFIFVYDMQTWTLSRSFGNLGRAQNEFLSPPQSLNIRDGKMQYYDRVRKTLSQISLDSMEIVDYRHVPYTAEFRSSNLVELGDCSVAVGFYPDTRVGYMHEDKVCDTSFEYPYSTGDVEGIYRGTVFQSEIKVPSDRKQILIRTLCSDCFEIYGLDGDELVREFVNEYQYIPEATNRAGRYTIDFTTSPAGYIRSYVTNDRIYLLWSDKMYSEVSNKGLASDVVHVYDWSGTALEQYKLPYDVAAFCVKNSYIYAVRDLDDEVVVSKLSLPRSGQYEE